MTARAAFFSDPEIKADYKATIRYVLTLLNTVSGVRYADDKAILAWQFGNEVDRTKPGEDIQRTWQAEMAAYAKGLDANYLIAYGRRFMPSDPDPNIDIIVNHYYHGCAHQPWRDWTTNVAVSTDLIHWKKYPSNPHRNRRQVERYPGPRWSPISALHDSSGREGLFPQELEVMLSELEDTRCT